MSPPVAKGLARATSSAETEVAAAAVVLVAEGWDGAWVASPRGWNQANASCGSEVMLLKHLFLPIAEPLLIVRCFGGCLAGELVFL